MTKGELTDECEGREGKRGREKKRPGREEEEKFHQRRGDVGGKQRVGRFTGEKNAERTGS